MEAVAINAPGAPQTPGTYSQAVSLTGVEELVFISGQIPADKDGAVPDGALAQATQIWENIDAPIAGRRHD